MENTKPGKLQLNLGRRQAVSHPSAVTVLMEEYEREKMEEIKNRTLRIERFIRLHGKKNYGMCPAADQCLNKALSQVPPEVWQDFIARLGKFTSRDMQECINKTFYLGRDFPWQVALTDINTTWKNIIATAGCIELWTLCDIILNEFRVPHEDTANCDCAVPASEHENGNAVSVGAATVTTILVAQPSLDNEIPVQPLAPSRNVSVTDTRTSMVNALTTPVANELNTHNSSSDVNRCSLLINGNHAAERPYVYRVTLPQSDHSRAEPQPNAPHSSLGAVSLSNMNESKRTAFLTYSPDAEKKAKQLKKKIRRRIQDIRIITHDNLDNCLNFTPPEKIDRIFDDLDVIIPIISTQYLEDTSKVEVDSSNANAAAIRWLYVKYLDKFFFDGCKNLKVRAWRLPDVPFEKVKKLPGCLNTALLSDEKLVEVLHSFFDSRKNASGNPEE